MKNKKSSARYGEFFETSHATVFDKFEFEGPLMHVGSKVNIEDNEAFDADEYFRKFLKGKLHGNDEVMGVDMFDGHNVDKVGFRINEVRNERKVFLLNSELTSEIDAVSDRYMPYLSIEAVGVKNV